MRILSVTLVLAISIGAIAQEAQPPHFVDTHRSDKVVEVEVHAMGGISALTQNYHKAISGVGYDESAPGVALGMGVRVDFPLNHFFALTTGLNLLWSHNTATLTMMPEQSASSTMYLSNSYLYAQMPLLATFSFNMSRSAVWYVETGCYFATGVWGKETARIFTTTTNQLDQLVIGQYRYKRNYFREDDPVIAAHHTLDVGLTIGSGLKINQHWRIGVSLSYGLKNAAKNVGPLNVKYHNIWYLTSIGYQF